ncbi:MAG: pilin [Gammaproteobacteria bacterium]|nr:pilin [Gammaproteobacteria bacterium]
MNLFEKSNKGITNNHGFTLIELMITVAVVLILATIALPSNLISRQRSEVAEALHMTDNIRQHITDYYNSSLSFPADNNEAGEPEPDLLIGNKVSRIEIENGAIHITMGNKVITSLQGKILSIRPAVVTGSPNSPISWLCGSDKPVPGMTAVGINKTDLADAMVPASCGN